MEITCPGAGANIKVRSGTICVKGKFIDNFTVFDGLTVRVRVVNGFVSLSSAPPAWPKIPGDVDIPATGLFWCAQNVAIPNSTDGAPLTAFAWLLFGGSGSGSAGSAPVEQQFQAGGLNPVDCCLGCGSGISGLEIQFAAELASSADLLVTVSSGKHAGEYRATAITSMKWNVTIGGVPYTLVCVEGANLTFHGPTSSAPSISFEADPFSATFPGHILGAADEIVVIVA